MENENTEKQEFFKTYLGIKNKNVLSSLEQMAYVWKVKDKEVIIREGEPLPCVPFLVSGIVKGYCESKGDGKEHVSCFGYLKGDIVVGISNLSVNVKSLLTIESISSCTMLCVPIPELLKLIEQSPEMMRLYNRALSLAYKKLIEHEDIVANHRAKERYQYLLIPIGIW